MANWEYCKVVYSRERDRETEEDRAHKCIKHSCVRRKKPSDLETVVGYLLPSVVERKSIGTVGHKEVSEGNVRHRRLGY